MFGQLIRIRGLSTDHFDPRCVFRSPSRNPTLAHTALRWGCSKPSKVKFEAAVTALFRADTGYSWRTDMKVPAWLAQEQIGFDNELASHPAPLATAAVVLCTLGFWTGVGLMAIGF
jgi:hypothetical protein